MELNNYRIYSDDSRIYLKYLEGVLNEFSLTRQDSDVLAFIEGGIDTQGAVNYVSDVRELASEVTTILATDYALIPLGELYTLKDKAKHLFKDFRKEYYSELRLYDLNRLIGTDYAIDGNNLFYKYPSIVSAIITTLQVVFDIENEFRKENGDVENEN